MKTTYLVYSDVKADNKELVLATQEEWDAILETNRSLPREQRRFFIKDKITDGNDCDVMYIETSREEYNKWHSKQAMQYKKIKAKLNYSFLSLDSGITADGGITLAETLPDELDLEGQIIDEIMLKELRVALNAWRDWANELFDYYLDGMKKDATRILCEKYGLSERCIQKRKKMMEDFIKKFLQK